MKLEVSVVEAQLQERAQESSARWVIDGAGIWDGEKA